MDYPSIRMEMPCLRCGAMAVGNYRQHAREESVEYSASLSCSSCGLRAELDGDTLPESVRDRFYERDGQWTMRIDAVGSERVAVLRALRDLSQADLPTTSRMLSNLPASLLRGTLCEMDFAVGKLRNVGAEATAMRISDR